jgi:hypothetical protein
MPGLGGFLAGPHFKAPGGNPTISLACNSQGNYFFNQIRDLVASGLRELGCHIVLQSEREGFSSEADLQVIIAPHEFFFLGDGPRLRQCPWPSNVILITTEQPTTPWFAQARECLPQAHAVWDIDFNTTRHLRRLGVACDHLPLGYVPDHEHFERVARLAEHYGSSFLEEHLRSTSGAGGPLARRPLDLVFIGGMTERREAFFTRCAPLLADFKSYIHLFRPDSPLIQGKNAYLDTASVVGLSQRSKILLNIHRADDVYFEWQRIVLHGIWQKTLVVSEECSVAPPFRAGIDFVAATIDDLPDTLCYYLTDPRGRREAQEIAENGHETLVRECRMSRFLKTLLSRHALEGAVLAHFESSHDALDTAGNALYKAG